MTQIHVARSHIADAEAPIPFGNSKFINKLEQCFPRVISMYCYFWVEWTNTMSQSANVERVLFGSVAISRLVDYISVRLNRMHIKLQLIQRHSIARLVCLRRFERNIKCSQSLACSVNAILVTVWLAFVRDLVRLYVAENSICCDSHEWFNVKPTEYDLVDQKQTWAWKSQTHFTLYSHHWKADGLRTHIQKKWVSISSFRFWNMISKDWRRMMNDCPKSKADFECRLRAPNSTGKPP